jgi:hypothetical protein
MAEFPFSDLHSFKDYVGFVRLCAPDQFPKRDGVSPQEQWTLQLAFEGLRVGLNLAVQEKGDLPAFAECRLLFDQACSEYQAGRMKEGYFKMGEAKKLLKKIRTW